MNLGLLLRSGGPVLLIIIGVSIYAVYLFFQRFFKLSQERLDTDALMLRVNAAVRDRDLESAIAACEEHGGPVARVLKAALLKLPYGRAAVEAAFEEAYLTEEQNLSKGLRPLATISQISTLLGLLGTVIGITAAFLVVGQQGTGDPQALAGGIGQALTTTAAGLIVAIPTIIGQSYLSSRVEKILLELEKRREELMGNVAQAVATKRDPKARDNVRDSEVEYETIKTA
jgi:biopolymer transport protein ExbB